MPMRKKNVYLKHGKNSYQGGKEEEKIIAFIIESENFVEITILLAFKKETDDEVGDLLPAMYKFLMNSIPISERQEQGTNVFLQ